MWRPPKEERLVGVVTNKADLTKAQIAALIERGALPPGWALPLPPAEKPVTTERKSFGKSTRKR